MPSTSTHCTRGFTLIELCIVLALMLTLMAAAVPTYSASLASAKAVPALRELAMFGTRMEKTYQREGSYGDHGRCAVPDSAMEHFAIHCALSANGRGYQLDAVGTGSMAGYHFRTDEQGRQQTISHPRAAANAGSAAMPCWSLEGRRCGA